MTTPMDGSGGRRRFTDGVEGFASVIGPGVSSEGTFEGSTDLRLMGTFTGEMSVDGLVWIGPEGRFTGGIEATDVLIEGRVSGTIRATGKIELRSSAQVEADLAAKRIAAAEGSFFEGSVTMIGDQADGIVAYSEKRQDGDRSAVEPAPDE